MILNIVTDASVVFKSNCQTKVVLGSSWQNDRYQKAHPASVMQASPVASVNILTCLPPSKWHLIRSKNKHKNIIKHSFCLTTLKLCAANLLHKWSCWHLVKQSARIPSALFLEQTSSFCTTFALLVLFLELLLGVWLLLYPPSQRIEGPHTTSQRSLSGPYCSMASYAHLNEIYQNAVCIHNTTHSFIILLSLGLPYGLWELGSTTGAWSQALCSGSIDSEPLDRQGISYNTLIKKEFF